MSYCKRCLNPVTRPNLEFDDEGICMPCRFSEQARQGHIDWAERRRELDQIAQWGKNRRHDGYDCIVTVSGGKDSMRQAFYVRDELKLRPLLISCVYPPEQLVDRGAYNLSNLVEQGFDCVSLSLNPQIWKKMMQQAFLKYANWCKSTELALYAIPVHLSLAYEIPLIFLGENPAFTIGEKCSGLGGDASGMRHSNTLAGGGADHLLTDQITQQDIHFYSYPAEQKLIETETRLIYLGFYIEGFNHYKNAEIAISQGLKIRNESPEEMGDINGVTALDEDFVILNQMIKHVKLGYGRVTDQVVEAINAGLMDRETGVDLVKKYDGKCAPKFIKRFCNYLEISEQQFWQIVESFRNKDLWEQNNQGEWKLKVEPQ